MTPELEQAILAIGQDRRMAHALLFTHRHTDVTPPFHAEIIDLWHSRQAAAMVMAFREAGKSTIAEEAFIIGAAYQLFHNAIIVGSTEKRACERLRAVKHEFETNEFLHLLFGKLTGHVWNEAEIILANGVRITAVGRGQSLRGTKHLHHRPDFCFCDDIEDHENVTTPEARSETLSWFMSTLRPALDKYARIRVNATPLHREALPFAIQNRLKWPTKIFPIEYIDEYNRRKATWPERYDLEWIDRRKKEFENVGKLDEFMREYMCVAEDPKLKTFTKSIIKVETHNRTWHPTWAFLDPARTVKLTSASTGWAVWSWIGNRLIVWDGGGDYLMPDALVAKCFSIDEEFHPALIEVEIDGLHEFLEQPLRHEMTRRGVILPIDARKAPKGKIQFIESLQPFFKAGEVIFAKPLPELEKQLLNFPTGRIDAPNALAYALLMRPGQAVFENFSGDNVVDVATVGAREPTWLCVNARNGYVTAVLVQLRNGILSVIADWAREGDPGGQLDSIFREASIEAGQAHTCRVVAPPEHFGGYSHLGLRGACGKIPVDLRRGGPPEVGRDEIRSLISRRIRDRSALQVALGARWTLNALAATYAYEIDKHGRLAAEPRDGLYRCLMEGLCSFTAMMRNAMSADEGRPNVQFTPSGQKYISALPGASGVLDVKNPVAVGGAVNSRPFPTG